MLRYALSPNSGAKLNSALALFTTFSLVISGRESGLSSNGGFLRTIRFYERSERYSPHWLRPQSSLGPLGWIWQVTVIGAQSAQDSCQALALRAA